MGSTIWIGDIHFSGADIPVKLHSAVSQQRVQFHLLHKKDRVRLQQQMICAAEKKPVPREEQVKGYHLDERKYVLIDPEEIEQAEPEKSRLIDVHEFVKLDSVDPVYMDRTYYLEPDASQKSYTAFAAALKNTGTCGICTWSMRKRAYYGALMPSGGAVRLCVLRYADEIISAASLGLEKFPLQDKELEIGTELIDRLTIPFEPGKYKDAHREKLMSLIEKKARGEKVLLLKPKHLKATDPEKLLETLKKSLKKAA